MGSGFKDFAPGGILTAADVDGYLMRQTIMTFASAAARDAALASILDEGMVVYLEDAPNRLMYYTGSAWRYIVTEPTSFTPTWSNLTVGNATQVASYWYEGSTLNFQALVSFGSTSVMGANPAMTLPNAHAAVGYSAGSASYHDTSAVLFFAGGWLISDAQTSLTLSGWNGGVHATAPFTWAITDNLFISGRIRYI